MSLGSPLRRSLVTFCLSSVEELVPDFERIRVLLDHEGNLHWEPGGIFRTTCDIDIAYFPFDTQRCPLLIGAYSYYSSKLNITNARSTISTHDYRLNGEWEVHSTMARWVASASRSFVGYSSSIQHLQSINVIAC